MFKIPLKSAIFAIITAFFALSNPDISASGNGLQIGEQIPNPEFLFENIYNPANGLSGTERMYDYKENKTLLIAFMPDITHKNNYAEIMLSAFSTYFAEGLAFGDAYDWQFYRGTLKILVVTNNDESAVREYLGSNYFDIDIAPDINMDLAHSFGISKWNSSGDGAFVYVVDKTNKVTYASYDYKGEGEKLRAVQKEIFTQLDIKDPNINLSINGKIPFPGDDASDFEFIYSSLENGKIGTGETARLSDFYGKKNVIIAFYPAPFSMSCAMELTAFDAYAENQTLQNISGSLLGSNDDVEILMVSNSGLEILNKWKDDMNVKNVKLVSDYNGKISSQYGSYNPLGFYNRTIFIIDKQGKISYIDWNYNVDDTDFGLVKEHLNLISQK